MKVLLIHAGYPLNKAAGEGVRTMNMAKSLSEMGHTVVILILYNILYFRIKNIRFVLTENNVKQIHIPTFPTSRLLRIALFYNRLVVGLVALLTRAQVIQAEVTWSASTTAFVKQIPLITDFHSDLVPELEAINRNTAFIEKAHQDNIYALSNSHSILCVSRTLHNNLTTTYNLGHKCNLLPCSVDFNIFTKERLSSRKMLRSKLGLTDKIVLSYLGGTHEWQCLEQTLDIFKKLKQLDQRYYFCLFTNGDLSRFQNQIDLFKDSLLTMPLSKDNLVEYLSVIDVGFVVRDNLLLNANSSPTKTGEYMAVGAMVVATKFSGDAPELIKSCGFGYTLKSIYPSNDEILSLHNNIIHFISDYECNSKHIRNYIEYARDWSRNKEKLSQIYSSIELK